MFIDNKTEQRYLLGYQTVWYGRQVQVFRRTLMSPSSG